MQDLGACCGVNKTRFCRPTLLEGVPNAMQPCLESYLDSESRHAAERSGDRWQDIFEGNTCIYPRDAS